MSTRKTGPRQPICWESLPHDGLLQKALASMAPGSRERAPEDSRKHALKRQLPKMEPSVHSQYVELECAWLVELLRAVRDEYRNHLKNRGCKSPEVYWVVFRCGIVPYALKILRAKMFDYIMCSQVDRDTCRELFGVQIPAKVTPPYVSEREIPWHLDARQLIEVLISEDALRKIARGGPFGRDGQVFIARARPWSNWIQGNVTLVEHIKERQKLWDVCRPWTEGLARLFDVTQEELEFQYDELPEEGRREASKFVDLSPLERIVYRHLRELHGATKSRRYGDDCWIALTQELDRENIPLDELDPTARNLRLSLQRKHHQIDGWEQCLNDKAIASLEDGPAIKMKRATTHFLCNVLGAAEKKLGKRPPTKTTTGNTLTANNGKVIGKTPNRLTRKRRSDPLLSRPSSVAEPANPGSGLALRRTNRLG